MTHVQEKNQIHKFHNQNKSPYQKNKKFDKTVKQRSENFTTKQQRIKGLNNKIKTNPDEETQREKT